MRITKLTSTLTVLLIALTLAVSLASAEQKTFKIGLCLSFSGPTGAWGKIFSQGDQMVADYFNAKGGLNIGGERYRIELIEADNQFTAEGAATAGRRLIEADKVNIIHGGLVTQDTLGLQEVSEPAKMISMTTGAADEVISKSAGKRYAFRAYISYSETFPGMMKWFLKRYPDKRKVALLDMDYDSAWRAHELMKKLAGMLNFEIVYDEFYPGGTKDFYPFISKMMMKKPDLILNLASPPPDWALRIKQSRELGFKGLFMECHPLELDAMAPIAGAENLEGIIGYDYLIDGPGSNEATRNFKEKYVQKYGQWDTFAALVAAPLASLLMAYEKAGSLDSEKVLAVIEEGVKWNNFTGLTGAFGGSSRYGNPRQWLSPQYMHVAKGGKAVPIKGGEISVNEMLHGWD